jgi:hypothetical protein
MDTSVVLSHGLFKSHLPFFFKEGAHPIACAVLKSLLRLQVENRE